MSWTPLQPIAKSTGRPMVSAAVGVLKDGSAKITVYLSGMMHDECGARETCNALAGAAETAGQIKLDFLVKDGAFTLGKFANGGRRLTLPAFDGVPVRPTTTHPCRVVEKVKDSIVIALPLNAWAAEIASRDKAPAGAPAPKAPALAVAKTTADGPLDLVSYFNARGHTVHRLAGDRLSIDGEVYAKPAALARVNTLRAKAGLPALALMDVA